MLLSHVFLVCYGKCKYVLISLHWLPVKYKTDLKNVLFVYKSLHNQAPQYLSDLLHPYTQSRALRSTDSALLHVPRARLKTEVIGLFLLLALSCGIVSQFISELPQLSLFLSLHLKLIFSPWHLIFFDLLCNDPLYYLIHFTVCVS